MPNDEAPTLTDKPMMPAAPVIAHERAAWELAIEMA